MLREGVEAHDNGQLRQHLALTTDALQTQTATFQAQMAAIQTQVSAIVAGGAQGAVAADGAAPARVLHVPRDHATVQAAVDAADAGDRVVVAAGVYSGKVRILNKQVEIVGVAQGGRVVLEYEGNDHAVCVTGAAATVTLSNLTIRQRGGVTNGKNYGAISAVGGSTVQVEGCDLSSEAGAGVGALQEGTDLQLTNCTVHNCNDSGVQISINATAAVEGCTSRDNGRDGITVQRGASATLRGNTCTGNQKHGICIYEGEGHGAVSAVVENNQLTGNTGQSLYVSVLCHARVQQANNVVR